MTGYHECAKCAKVSGCPCPSCAPRQPEGRLPYRTDDHENIICPYCGHAENFNDAEERAMRKWDAERAALAGEE